MTTTNNKNSVSFSSIRHCFGDSTFDLIRSSKILVVGSGGIGCELLKNLVSCGFVNIETIDLDTIDVSNLNRQFLFRNKHVKESKAIIASQVVNSFYTKQGANVIGHLDNIKNGLKFDLNFFNSFDLILNALDNRDARKYVNRICISIGKSFIESGTQGFLGQILPIVPKYKSACWECRPVGTNNNDNDSTNRTYPVCTIRSTPDKAVHCIVWSKLIFNLLFGDEKDDEKKREDNMLRDLKVE